MENRRPRLFAVAQAFQPVLDQPEAAVMPSCVQTGIIGAVILNGATRSEESIFFASPRMTILLL